jgi:hypothetical protein
MEEDMREIAVIELEFMATSELIALRRSIDQELPGWPRDSIERLSGRITRRNIGWVLARRGLEAWP